MKVDKKSSLFQLVNGVEQPPTDSVIWYINRFLSVHPYAGVYTVDDTEHVSRAKDVRSRNFHPSGDTMKCERLLYWERDPEYAPLLQERPDPHLQCVFKVGSALHAMIQAWFEAWNGLDGFPRCVQNEMPLLDEDLHIGGYIDSVLIFPGTSFKIPIELKGLAVDTEIPTPKGFVTIHDISVGDEVFDGNGDVCRVIGKSGVHHKKCYEVEFDDHSKVVCDHDHRWNVLVRRGKTEQTLTTEDMASIGVRYRCGNEPHERNTFTVRLSGAAKYQQKDLPIDPYVFGCWLADGSKSCNVISKPAEHGMWSEIKSRGYRFNEDMVSGADGRCPARTIYGMMAPLRELGVLGKKHIPRIYMESSYQQRLDLLRGIMDGDGAYATKRKHPMLTMTDKELVLQVKELVESLGAKTSYCEYTGHGFGRDVGCYSVRFNLPSGEIPFLCRNNNVPKSSMQKCGARRIIRIEEVDSVPTQCISVDSADCTYLFGRNYIKTHNTTNSNTFSRLSGPLAAHKLQVGCYIMELDAPFGIVLYINKDTQELKEFKVEPFDMSPVLRRWCNVRSAVDARDMSGLECGCSTLGQWEKCPAHGWCRNADEFKEINLYGNM